MPLFSIVAFILTVSLSDGRVGLSVRFATTKSLDAFTCIEVEFSLFDSLSSITAFSGSTQTVMLTVSLCLSHVAVQTASAQFSLFSLTYTLLFANDLLSI